MHLWPQGVDARRFHPDRYSEGLAGQAHGRRPGRQAAALRRTPRPREGHRRAQGVLGEGSRSRGSRSSATDPRAGTWNRSSRVPRRCLRACCRARTSRRPTPPPTFSCSLRRPRRWGSRCSRPSPPGCPCSRPAAGAARARWWRRGERVALRAGLRDVLVAAVRRFFSDEACGRTGDATPARWRRSATGEISTRTLRGYYEQALGER